MHSKSSMLNRPLMFAAIMAVAPIAQGQAQTVGVSAAIRNNVQLTTQANPSLHHAILKERVSLGNQIVTAQASVIQILLLDQTVFTVGANAKVNIDHFVYDPNKNLSAVSATIAKGAFRFMSSKALHANAGQSSIKTPVASIGIRGTILEGVVGQDAVKIAKGEPAFASLAASPDTATLIVLRGPGAAVQGDEATGAIDVTANGTTVPVEKSGYAVLIPGTNQSPVGPILLSDNGLMMLYDLLRTTPRKTKTVAKDLLHSNPINDTFSECVKGPNIQTALCSGAP